MTAIILLIFATLYVMNMLLNSDRRNKEFRSRLDAILFASLPALLILGFLVDKNGIGSDFAEGTRTGYVTKTSYKGGMFKSYEALMLTTATPAQYTQDLPTWRFSSLDPEMMKRVDASEGHFVRIHYRQWISHPLTIDTDYEVTGVDILQ
ncbi:hypothetical protein [Paraburkholderia fungorum]|jgi:hypothetical protein|uniref:hypothetical protein n=1 Tax=Paraburkholderia fungorum TaxID=134537 RepID=UPI000D05D34A|nr:hypothetical protein [Paraburkholderia fungorum]PRZ45372.1 hypothetical protein BX589_13951 [Paraburkholderia fungorum]